MQRHRPIPRPQGPGQGWGACPVISSRAPATIQAAFCAVYRLRGGGEGSHPPLGENAAIHSLAHLANLIEQLCFLLCPGPGTGHRA